MEVVGGASTPEPCVHLEGCLGSTPSSPALSLLENEAHNHWAHPGLSEKPEQQALWVQVHGGREKGEIPGSTIVPPSE